MDKSNNFTLSVSLVTFNSGLHLDECLSSILWADEIIAIDLGSTDNTIEILSKYKCKVLSHEWVPIVECIRNEQIKQCKSDWILILDPDEVVPNELSTKIISLIKSNNIDYIYVRWKNIIFGKWIKHTGWNPDSHLRLFKNGCVKWEPAVHSEPTYVEKSCSILPYSEEDYIIHYNFSTIDQFIEKLNRYTTNEAIILRNKTITTNIFDLITKPNDEFINRYIFNQGYKDGFIGLLLSLFMAFYTFVTYAKYIEMDEKYKISADDNSSELLNQTTYIIFKEWLKLLLRLVRKVF